MVGSQKNTKEIKKLKREIIFSYLVILWKNIKENQM